MVDVRDLRVIGAIWEVLSINRVMGFVSKLSGCQEFLQATSTLVTGAGRWPLSLHLVAVGSQAPDGWRFQSTWRRVGLTDVMTRFLHTLHILNTTGYKETNVFPLVSS